jgi:hypothetical protein
MKSDNATTQNGIRQYKVTTQKDIRTTPTEKAKMQGT